MSNERIAESKRQELEARIEAAQLRQYERNLADRASEAVEAATDFVKSHPLATVAGGIAVGLLIGSMTKPGKKMTGRGAVLASTLADMAIAYGLKALDNAQDAARKGGDALEDLSDNLSDSARSAKRELSYKAEGAGDAVRKTARKTSKAATRKARDIRDRLRV